MLVLTRRANQSIVIGNEVVVTVLEVRGDQVRLGITAPRSIDVHREEVYKALQEANREAVGVTNDALDGASVTDAMAREYARAHRSESGDLNRYGERLADFLDDFPHTADLPYLPDVARMEWLAHRAHFAADAPAFDARALASLEDERLAQLRLQLAPACALLASAWPLARLWTIHQDGYAGSFAVDLGGFEGDVEPRDGRLVGKHRAS